MSYAYPILLDLAGGLVVVVGSGTVAARKARVAIAAGAVVRVIAPQFSDGVPAQVQRVPEAYAPHHLTGARLVFAATDDPAVNDAVVRDAKSAGIWVNRADAEEGEGRAGGAGNFVVPAKFEEGGVIVSVSAGSAAVSAAIRDRLKARFDPGWARVADVVRTLRPLVRASGLAPSRRAEILRELAGFIDADDQSEEAIRQWLQRRLAEDSR